MKWLTAVILLLAIGCTKEYTQSTRENYLASCVRGSSVDFCNCTLKEFEKTWDETTFNAVERSGQVTPEMMSIIRRCTP